MTILGKIGTSIQKVQEDSDPIEDGWVELTKPRESSDYIVNAHGEWVYAPTEEVLSCDKYLLYKETVTPLVTEWIIAQFMSNDPTLANSLKAQILSKRDAINSEIDFSKAREQTTNQ